MSTSKDHHTARPKHFAPAGQSTQMIIGATPTTDASILATSSQLYTDYKLRGVYYTGYSPTQRADSRLPLDAPPLVREHRLYEADWLIRHYEFRVDELTTPDAPNLDLEIDPKLAWALRHRATFPVDVNTADREPRLTRAHLVGRRALMQTLRAARQKAKVFDRIRHVNAIACDRGRARCDPAARDRLSRRDGGAVVDRLTLLGHP